MKSSVQKDSQPLKIYIISDSIGETAEKVVYATMIQFPNLRRNNFFKFPFINNEGNLKEILESAVVENAVLVTTLVDPKLNNIIKEYVEEYQLEHIDYLSPLLGIMTMGKVQKAS